MKKDTFTFTDSEGLELFAYRWLPESSPIAVLQLVHGMAEHAGRYERFAEYLTERGIAVYADDHRGHGKTAKSLDDLGYLGDKDGFNYMVSDEYLLTSIIKKELGEIPLFLMGHSMGSFISRHYITKYANGIKGLIISGTGINTYSELLFGRIVSFLMMLFIGRRKKATFIENTIFRKYNAFFHPNRTEFDWLSRDEEEVDKFIKDPLCGAVFPVSFYYYFFTALNFLLSKKAVDKIPKDLPILVISGDADPVGGMGVGVTKVYQKYLAAKFQDLQFKLYIDARHELLNESNRQDVTEYLYNWIVSRLN